VSGGSPQTISITGTPSHCAGASHHQLPRSLSRQTLAAWRRGDQAVPAEVMVAMAVIARVTLIDASVAVAMRVMSEPTADPGLAAALRRYYGAGRVEMPQS